MELEFEKGVPVSLNGEKEKPAVLIAKAERDRRTERHRPVRCGGEPLGGHEEPRRLRDPPGGTILYKAHEVLETLTLDKLTAHKKRELAITFGELVYDGQWFSPLRKALSAFVTSTQEHVTGKVRLNCTRATSSTPVSGRPIPSTGRTLPPLPRAATTSRAMPPASSASTVCPPRCRPLYRKTTKKKVKRKLLTAVTGINWGDEGKGRVIDLLAENADIVARYQGGNNAGHTVVTDAGQVHPEPAAPPVSCTRR